MAGSNPSWSEPRAWVDHVHLPVANKQVRVLQAKLSDFASFPKHHPSLNASYGEKGDGDGVTAPANKFFAETFTGFKTAMQCAQRWVPPAQLKDFVETSYRTLRSELFSTGGSKIVRNTPSGRVNVKSLVRELNKPSSEFDNIYQRRHKTAAKRPVICLLAQADYAKMWGDENYIPHVVSACIAVAWAGIIMGCEVHAYAVKNSMNSNSDNYHFYPIITPYETLDETDLALFFNRDLYRWASGCLSNSHPETQKAGGFDERGSIPMTNRGYFVEASKELFKPDLTFFWGECLDHNSSDFVIGTSDSIDVMLDKIVEGIRSNKSIYKAA